MNNNNVVKLNDAEMEKVNGGYKQTKWWTTSNNEVTGDNSKGR